MALEEAWSFLKMARPTQEHIDALPPVPEGHQRLYQGSTAGKYPLAPKGEDDWGYQGRWFHPDWRQATKYAHFPGTGDEKDERQSGKKVLMYVDVPDHVTPHVNDPERSYQHLRDEHGMKGEGELGIEGGLKQGRFTKPQVRYPPANAHATAGQGSGDFWLDDSDDFNLEGSVRRVHQWED